MGPVSEETPDRPRMDGAQETTQSPGQRENGRQDPGEDVQERRERFQSLSGRRFIMIQGNGVLVIRQVVDGWVPHDGPPVGALNQGEAVELGLRAGDLVQIIGVERGSVE